MQPLRRSAITLLVGVTAATALAVVDAPPASSPDPGTRRAVTALLSGSAQEARAAVPEDFSRRIGYAPVLEEGSITNPTGSCSSPVPLPEVFETACRQHDYGYDLLRYGDSVGGALPARARSALDDQFEREALDSCESTEPGPIRASCTRWAHIAAGFVRANTWRQDGSVPDPEDPLSLATGGAALVSLGAAGSLVVGGLRRLGRRTGRRGRLPGVVSA